MSPGQAQKRLRRKQRRRARRRAESRTTLGWLEDMGDVMIEFARPVLDNLPAALTVQALQAVLQFAAVAWNFALIAESASDEEFDLALANLNQMCREVPQPERQDFRTLMLELIHRKLELFADDPRFVIALDAFRDGGQMYVNAAYGLR